VHGIGANPDYTWTTSAVNWLEKSDMLPLSHPKARIMRFGYDSQWFGEHAVKQRLSTVAESLLLALKAERKVGLVQYGVLFRYLNKNRTAISGLSFSLDTALVVLSFKRLVLAVKLKSSMLTAKRP
jgi:hypothetical protein